jgi:hypothetical protein
MTENKKKLHEEIFEKLSALAASAFGLVAALAWNDAIQEAFKQFLPAGNGLLAKFAYAILVTLLIVFVTWQIGRISDHFKNR